MWFINRSDTNRAVQPHKTARSLKFRITYFPSSEKALIIVAITAKLICVFVFAYANCLFSNEAAQLLNQMASKDL